MQSIQISRLNSAPFGAIVEEFDCASATEESIRQLQSALQQYQLLLFPNQQHLLPAQEVQFYRSVNPDADSIWRDQVSNPWERFKVEQGNAAGTYQIPKEPGVLVLGKGKIDHFGLQVILGGDRSAYGEDEGSQVLGGGALQWHIDGTFYDQEPCLFTQMRCIEAPTGSGQWLDYNDGSNGKIWCEAGSTAFASGRIAFDALDSETQKQTLDVRVHYLSNPFQSTYHLGNTDNGLRVIDAPTEHRHSDNPGIPVSPSEDPKAKNYPLIWTCPLTGKKALMPHPRCMDHLEIVSSGEHLTTTVSRQMTEEVMRPGIEPDLVYVHPWAAGDLVIWDNRSIWHSATGKLSPEDRRIQHLTAFNSVSPPS
ncbi:MAG: TauD/TfdA dioxygenase family protein [bacterium]